MAKVARHRNDFLVIGAALDDHVDLDRREADFLRRLNAPQYLGHRKVDIVHAPKSGVVQPVQAHGHALQAGVFQALRFFGEQRTVGGQRDVQRLACGRF